VAGDEQHPVLVHDEDVAVFGTQTQVQTAPLTLRYHLDVRLAGQRVHLCAQIPHVRRVLSEPGLQARRDLIPEVPRGEARETGEIANAIRAATRINSATSNASTVTSV
jgi:hypothetical protein